MIELSQVQNVADLEFGIQKKMFEATGGVLHRIKGYLFEGDKVDSVHLIEHEGDFVKAAVELIPRMLTKYPLVVVVAEAWVTSSRHTPSVDGNGSKEVVVIQFYTNDVQWVMMCPISRNPDTLKSGALQMVALMSSRGEIVGNGLPKSSDVRH